MPNFKKSTEVVAEWQRLEEIRQGEKVKVNKICQILDLSRSQYYRKVFSMEDYQPKPESPPAEMEKLIRERSFHYAAKYPFYGHRKVWKMMEREGLKTSRYSVFKALKMQNLLLKTNWRKELRERAKERKEYIHKPEKPLELLQLDIKYVILPGYGTYYTVNVIDYFSRYILVSDFQIKTSGELLIEITEKALPEGKRLGLQVPAEVVVVTDNGPQMISNAFKGFVKLQTNPFAHVRTAIRHPETIGCIERWRQSLKYEEILANDYADPIEAKLSIQKYREFYNKERIHQAIDYKTPYEVVLEEVEKQRGNQAAPKTPENINFSTVNFCSKND
jgi:putative transposase